MEAIVHPDGRLIWRGQTVRCALGNGGVRVNKEEGDGATPAGVLPVRRILYRADRGKPPRCVMPIEPIAPTDDYGALAERLQVLGAQLLIDVLERDPPCAEQPEQGITYAEKISPEDRLLDPARPALELERAVRALHPHVGARVQLPDGGMLGVRRAALLEDDPAPGAGDQGPAGGGVSTGEASPGLQARDGRLLLVCSPGVLELLEVQPPGARAMDAGAYLRGHAAPGRR